MADIINTTTTTAETQTYTNKTFYDRNVLEQVKKKFVYAKNGDQKVVPLRSGKKVEFRRWARFDPTLATTPLDEGVTPTGLLRKQEKVEAELKQYGAYFTYSDVWDKVSFDEIKQSGSDDIGELLGTVAEWVTRDVMAACNDVNYANSKTSRWALTAADKLTITDIRKAVRDLKKRGAPQYMQNGHGFYVCYVSPDTIYDIQADSDWKDANKYVNNQALFTGELGRIYGMIFVDASEAPIIRNSVNTTVVSWTSGTKTLVVTDDITDAAKAYLLSSGAAISINGTDAGIASVDQSTKSIVLAAGYAGTPTAGQTVRSKDGTSTGDPVHITICHGMHAYGTVELSENSGNIQFIVKDTDSGGVENALNQRGSVGAKIGAYAAVILNQDWILRIEHGVTGA